MRENDMKETTGDVKFKTSKSFSKYIKHMVFIAYSVHFEVTLGIIRDFYVGKVNYLYDRGN